MAASRLPHGRTRALGAIVIAALLSAPATARGAELLLQGAFEDAADSSYALSAPTGMAASRDGRNLYVAAFSENAINVFARNPATGALTHLGAVRDGENGVDGLGGVLSVDVTADGRNVYAAGRVDQSLAVFNRDVETGLLTFVGQKKAGFGQVTSLVDPRSIVESRDGRHVYIACEDAIVAFARNATGWPTYVQTVALPPLSGAQGIAVDPDGINVYVGRYDFAELRVYRRNPVWGGLTLIDVMTNGEEGVAGLAGIDAIAVSADGRSVYANGTTDSSIAHFARGPATGLLTFLGRQTDGVGGVDGLGLSAGLSIGGPRESRLFAGGADGAVAVFERASSGGALAFRATIPLPGSGFIGSGDQVLALGGNLYVANNLDNRLSVFAIAALHLADTEEDGIDGADGLAGAEGVAASPDGRHLYATGVSDDSVTVFAIDATTSALTATSVVTDEQDGVQGLRGATGVTLAPDGHHVYATGFSGAVVAFARNPATGSLTYVNRVGEGQNGAYGMVGMRVSAVSPDGRHIYTSAFISNAVTWLSRNVTTGAASFGGSLADGAPGVDGLAGAYGVAVSPDGRHVYAVGLSDDSLVVLARDAETGDLSFVSRVQDGVGGVDGLDAPTSVAVTGDGRHVYATGFTDNAVAVFARDAETGALTFIERQRDGEGGVALLGAASNVAVSDDGVHVVVSAQSEHAIAVFRRDPVTGRLLLAQTELDGDDGVTHLASPRGIAIARRGIGTYVAGNTESAVTAFAPEPASALLGAGAMSALLALARRRSRR